MVTNAYVGKTCPYCQTPIKPDGNVVACSACGMPHHADCWQENRGCTTFGCRGGAAPGAAGRALTQTANPAMSQPAVGSYPCPTCGYLLLPTDVLCPRCENQRRQAAAYGAGNTVPPPPVPQYQQQYGAYPGQPGALPQEYQKWNWGAFTLTLFWTAAMNQWGWFAAVLILSFIPCVNFSVLVISIYLGVKGNELAWQSRRWHSLQQFKATQDVWKSWGITLFIISIVLGFIGLIVSIALESGRY